MEQLTQPFITPKEINELKKITIKLKKESKNILERYKKTFLYLQKNIEYYKKAIQDTNKKQDLEFYFKKLIQFEKTLKICEKNLVWIDKKFNKHPQEVKVLALKKFDIFCNQLPEEIKQNVSEDNLKIITEFITEFYDIGRHLEVNLKTLQKENFGIDHAVLGAYFLQNFFNDETIEVGSYLAQCIDFAIRNHSTTTEQEDKITEQKEDKLKGQFLHFLKQMDMLANLLVYTQDGELEKIGEWGWVNKEEFNTRNAEISREVMESLKNKELINSKNIKTMGDVICKYISWLNIIDDCYCSQKEKEEIIKEIFEKAKKIFDKKGIEHRGFDEKIKEIALPKKQQYNVVSINY